MKNVQDNTTGNGFAFSFKNPQAIHILVETFCLLVIVMYIRKNVRRLQDQIDDLKALVQKQQETLHLHQQLLQGKFPSHLASQIPRPPPSSPTNPGSVFSPSLPDFGTIASIFTVPLESPHHDHHPSSEPTPPDTTIIDTNGTVAFPPSSVSLEEAPLTHSPVGDTSVPEEDLEKELENEIRELEEEEKKQERKINNHEEAENITEHATVVSVSSSDEASSTDSNASNDTTSEEMD